jgi:LPXTG-motif cell wall-anchored protein
MSCGLWILLLLPQTLFAGVGSAELIENGLQYHGKTIEYAGEVIGDLMARKNHAWINVNDGNNAIGIWSERAIIPPLEYLGSYANRGDTVLVRGVFHRSCPEHGGDMDIHASAITIVAAGGPVSHRTSASAVLAAAALLLASLGSYILYKRKEKARREFPARTP